MWTPQDLKVFASKGISEAHISEQLNRFQTGFPFLKLDAAASLEKGILAPDGAAQDEYLSQWNNYTQSSAIIVKFVPASGAASRMFKDLFEFLDGEGEVSDSKFMQTFFERITQFAFYDELNETCLKRVGDDVPTLMKAGRHKMIISTLLKSAGMNYGALPKGLLKFHAYPERKRTPLEEHLVEGALYASGQDGKSHIHFTVSVEHQTLFEALVREVLPAYEEKYGIKYDVSFSTQKPSTDTIAGAGGSEPFRDNGELVFRPGGHGALIENLNDLEADVIFIKNIDNVVPDRLKEDTVHYKKLIAGVLVTLQKQAFTYIELLESGQYSHDELIEILQFVQKQLFCKNPDTKVLEDSELAIYLKNKLNRPIRVCGMVRNAGEPGGGPFLAYNADGTISLQILESSQIEMTDPEKKAMFEQGTHFNPVDLVCGVRDYKGDKFDLTQFVDKETGFISNKSKNGKELKALELPGLWNGAMSDWNTVFVEVPLSTFNPVKTVNDLLRDEHQ